MRPLGNTCVLRLKRDLVVAVVKCFERGSQGIPVHSGIVHGIRNFFHSFNGSAHAWAFDIR